MVGGQALKSHLQRILHNFENNVISHSKNMEGVNGNGYWD